MAEQEHIQINSEKRWFNSFNPKNYIDLGLLIGTVDVTFGSIIGGLEGRTALLNTLGSEEVDLLKLTAALGFTALNLFVTTKYLEVAGKRLYAQDTEDESKPGNPWIKPENLIGMKQDIFGQRYFN